MTYFLSIVWNPSEGIQIGSFTLRFYSLMFVIAFALGWYLMAPIFKRENEPQEKLDSLFVYMVVSILLGARLGHVIFYQTELIFQDPLSVILPFRFTPEFKFTGFQGLASHGAAIAVIIAMYLYKTRILKRSYLWILDRIVIPVASGAIFVRLGNFFNSEIYGPVTSGDHFYAVKFIRDDEFWADKSVEQITGTNDLNQAYKLIETDPQFINTLNAIPFRHPAQLYEAVGYVFVFLLLIYMYWKTDARKKEGLLFGSFLVTLFSIRILVESVKESQGGFENILGIMTTGQWLSIPFVIAGIYLIFKAKQTQTT
ncbi:prolipoprotein diacylglyceryl transferase [Flavobacterium luminosum]|uniref:Phosphatidylglycerol--prolipoprotein diacylglyceryl transferase n=1 Tax=Flavobacterium luminosum TaxID=2949086 RepID=A0ABT0TND0_9FLAO|nr:prolipoprotein diacylglyceryl transferase [Flavobacterium sp. HXWNR70]MCL9808589.1 prolipoprotein diacylglyceryl transferase [Flavobacterium sp. HXWNR70]